MKTKAKVLDKDTIPFVNVKEAARLKGLKYRTMHAYVQSGRIPSIVISPKCVLIERAWLEEWTPLPVGRRPKSQTVEQFVPKESWGKITAREQQIIDLLQAGHTKAFIAAYFKCAVSTVQNHITRLRSKGLYDYQAPKHKKEA